MSQAFVSNVRGKAETNKTLKSFQSWPVKKSATVGSSCVALEQEVWTHLATCCWRSVQSPSLHPVYRATHASTPDTQWSLQYEIDRRNPHAPSIAETELTARPHTPFQLYEASCGRPGRMAAGIATSGRQVRHPQTLARLPSPSRLLLCASRRPDSQPLAWWPRQQAPGRPRWLSLGRLHPVITMSQTEDKGEYREKNRAHRPERLYADVVISTSGKHICLRLWCDRRGYCSAGNAGGCIAVFVSNNIC